MMEKRRNTDGTFAVVHGMKRTKLYRVWCSMKERCNNPHNKGYCRYGNRGIKVCKQWEESFDAFREWALKTGYKEGLSIDRIRNDLGYSPNNCRWATTAQQNRNYSRNHLITYNGKTKCLADWADEFGINRATVLYRIKAGKPIEEVFNQNDGRTLRWKTTSPSFTK